MEACFERLARHARDRPDAPAIVERDAAGAVSGSVAYGELPELVARCARALRAHCASDAVVQLSLGNGVAVAIGFLAVLRAGLTVFPVSPKLGPAELARAAARAGASARIGDADLAAEHGLTALGRDPCALGGAADLPATCGRMLLQSSGTTGRGKIVVRDGPALDAVARNVAEAVALAPGDRVQAVIPMCHSYGIENALLAPLWAGARIEVGTDLAPEALRGTWRRAAITVLPGVPFLFELLAPQLELGEAQRVRAYSAGACLPAALRAECRRRGLAIGELYGATEIGSVTFLEPDAVPPVEGAVGFPMSDVEVRVLDRDCPDLARPLAAEVEGQLAIRAPSMLSAYLDGEDGSLCDGWFLTGDLGSCTADGQVVISGRLKLLIEVAGQKVNPQEVEAVLAEHPAIAAAVVTAWPVSPTLNRLRAHVELVAGAEPTPAAWRSWVAERLAPYKVPRRFEVVDALPRSALGKIRREVVA